MMIIDQYGIQIHFKMTLQSPLLLQVDVQTVMENYVYPIGLCVSILCLIVTFLLYSFLPQLRDLSGKFILAICAFQVRAFS